MATMSHDANTCNVARYNLGLVIGSLDLGLDYSRWAWTVGLNIESLFENVFKNKILLKNSNIKNNVMDLFSIKVSSVYV